MALFITFEGGEGSGKTFQARALCRRLAKLDIPVLLTHEPGGTLIGERLARWLKRAQNIGINPHTELLMFNASRSQLVVDVIRPALNDGKVVICDRYTDSTIAYQSYGRALELSVVESINNLATQGLTPGLTVMLDLPVEEGLARKKDSRRDRFERENLAFHIRVREGYLRMATDEPQRWLVIDASQSKVKIKQIIWQRVRQLL